MAENILRNIEKNQGVIGPKDREDLLGLLVEYGRRSPERVILKSIDKQSMSTEVYYLSVQGIRRVRNTPQSINSQMSRYDGASERVMRYSNFVETLSERDVKTVLYNLKTVCH
jgi:hypothetical protein